MRRRTVLEDLLQPYSMENKWAYVSRFVANRDMKDVFSNKLERIRAAEQIFAERWKKAIATVRATDTEFFID